jgi:hypothetical protein
MLPSLLAREIQNGLKHCLRTRFELSDPLWAGTVLVTDDTLPGGPRQVARASREDDYRVAWAVFEQHKGDS